MYFLVMVLDDSSRLNEVLDAWRMAGVPGITILESTGLNRVLPRHTAQPMFAGFSHILAGGRIGHHTLFGIIESMEIAEAAVAATEQVLGDLKNPHTGIIVALPVTKSWGIPEPYDEELQSEE